MPWESAFSCIILATLTAQSRAQGLITDVEGEGYGPKPSSSSMSAGMIVLCVVAGIVVLIGSPFSKTPIAPIPALCYLGMFTDPSHSAVSTTILFIIAKRRQWAMREVITRSARRATQAIKTPLSARFPRSQVARGMDSEFPTNRAEERSQKLKVNPKHNDIEKNSLITETEKARKGGNGRTWRSLFPSGHS
ncbi:hypothetical protein BDV38DRAFT_285661 [Aspergillus pseudotamarii]|uniref:Amino acid permease/ SLC12A domain-containing protein n=1 Tax=Aspergillus pseudotamarii TaxID=132259 RepID=A0A5N6SLZ2_ASPPS|nr:uncharacterized protein BDV38DRAFT_285661 [Aspergillus pseudotamarii]KAE8134711.1 hypothetical protein BDV38DRAFT_285661 [Aspergillus pseudotamarii]